MDNILSETVKVSELSPLWKTELERYLLIYFDMGFLS